MISHFYKNIYDSFSKKTLSLLHFFLVFLLHIAKQYNSSTPAINSHAQSQNDINARDSESCSTQQPQTLEKKNEAYGTNCGVYHQRAFALEFNTHRNLLG